MRNVPGRTIAFVIWILAVSQSFAQQISVSGGFLEDSLKLGENIHYWMTAEYPPQVELILPDTTYKFSPFEFSAKEYFRSKLKNNLICDSAVYTLQSYEIDEVQYLGLSAFVLDELGDSTRIEVSEDSILFHSLVPLATDTTQLKTNLDYQLVHTQFNYPVLWIIIGCLLVTGLVIYFAFGSKIRKKLLLRKLKKEYIKFSEQLTIQIRSLKEQPRQEDAEHLLTEWKRFLEKLENKPFSKLTTKEIMAMEHTKELNGTLKKIDRCVYGGIVNETIYKDFQAIEDFTQYRYSVITDQIKNSK